MAGGNPGSAGAAGAQAAAFFYTFDTTGSTQGFTLQTSIDTSPYKNLAALAADAGIPADGTFPTIRQADGKGQGVPATGALELTAHFTDWQQYLEVRVGLSPPRNLSGTRMHAAVEVTTPFLGGAYLYAKSGTQSVEADATGTGLSNGIFTPLLFDLETAVGSGGTFDPTGITEFGIRIYTDSRFDGGVFPGGEFTFEIDNVVAR